MSIATMNWALQQRLESPLHQILLYVIADSASPDGITRHCEPEYLVERTRMSRATVFRKMADLRAIGLLETFTHHGARGEQIYEVRLDLSKTVDVPAKARRTADDPESQSETQSDKGHAADTQSHSETQGQSQAETAAVSPVRPGQSQSCDRICPPLSKDSPPNPPPGGSAPVDVGEVEHFAEFFAGYPQHRVMDRPRAAQVFAALTEAERRQARAAAPLYADDLDKAKRRPKDAYKWLRDKGFEQYPHARLAESVPDKAFYEIGRPQIAAIFVADAILDRPPRELRSGPDGCEGLWLLPMSDDLLALSRFNPSAAGDWLVVEEASAECKAWLARLRQWFGAKAELCLIDTGETFDFEYGGQVRQMPKRIKGLRVPWRWPPRKDGTFIEANDMAEAEG